MANPEYLYLYLLIPVLILFFVWSGYQKKKLLARLGDPELISRLTATVSVKKRRWKQTLLILMISFIILALADPQIGTKLQKVKRKGVDIFIALDVSKSMLAEDVAPNRLAKAKHEIKQFIDQLQGDRVGLIAFSGLAFVQCPLTLDYAAAKLFLNDMDTGMIPVPGTAIAEAIKTADRSFVTKELKHKVLILITDGEDHEGDALKAAKEAARQGVVIYTIGIGSPGGAPIPEFDKYGNKVGYKKDRNGQIVTTKLDVTTLQKIAFETNGKFHISSTGESELNKIYAEISKMEKKQLSSRQFSQFEDRFQIFLLIGIILFVLELLLTERRSIKRLKMEIPE